MLGNFVVWLSTAEMPMMEGGVMSEAELHVIYLAQLRHLETNR